MTLNIISLAISIAAVAVSVAFAFRQTKMMETANTLPVLLDFFREFRGDEFRKKQSIMLDKLPSVSADNGLCHLPEEVQRPTIYVIHYYDNLGAMVAHGLISADVVLSVYGESVDRCWRLVEPYIKQERDIRGDPEYQILFEHIASLAERNQGREARRRLRLRSRTTTNMPVKTSVRHTAPQSN
jgi:hypothetical protein